MTKSGSLLKAIRPKASAAKSNAAGWPRCGIQQPYPCRNEEPGCGRGDAAQDVPEDRTMSLLKVQHTERKTDCPGYQKEAGNGGDCSDGAAQLCSDANGDADNVRAGQKLAHAHDIGEILIGYPSAMIDGDPARPDQAATEAAERDLEKCDEKGSKRNRLGACPLYRRP
jgi:hypothetical protein